jgi:hypothetical protein
MATVPHLCFLIPPPPQQQAAVARWRTRLPWLVGNRWRVSEFTTTPDHLAALDSAAYDALAVLQTDDRAIPESATATVLAFLAEGKPAVELAAHGQSVRLHRAATADTEATFP